MISKPRSFAKTNLPSRSVSKIISGKELARLLYLSSFIFSDSSAFLRSVISTATPLAPIIFPSLIIGVLDRETGERVPSFRIKMY